MDKKEEFLGLLRSVKRTGIDNLIEWLESTDFFGAPASTQYHGAYPGGLLAHSLNVYHRMQAEAECAGYDKEALILTSLLHDVCKANFYHEAMRNVKNPVTGAWEQKPYYTVVDQFPYGHGEKSVYLISKYIKLSDEESMAIRWHMGGFDSAVRGGDRSLSGAFEKYPLALSLHIADMQASYFDEQRK